LSAIAPERTRREESHIGYVVEFKIRRAVRIDDFLDPQEAPCGPPSSRWLSASVPFEIDGFLVEGNTGPPPAPGNLTITGKPRRAQRALPLIATVTTLTPGRP
jgi:hypothetical protein